MKLKGEKLMDKAINDASLQQAGTIYQYLIALKDCFELNDDDTLQIEVQGDVSIINNLSGIFQKEVKHHFDDKNLSDRDIDFWKTLANWYTEYDRTKSFSHLILSTTANISSSSCFHNWNELSKKDKLAIVRNIGSVKKEKEETFRHQYDRIFNESYNEENLLDILGKFTIESSQSSLKGISNEFSKYIRAIPEANRDGYIGALLGRILKKITDPPHKWEFTKKEFDEICQVEAAAYGTKGNIPLPNDFAKSAMPNNETSALERKWFVQAIKEIEYDREIGLAMSDYWKATMTIAKYFKDDLMYCESLDEYVEDLSTKLHFAKSNSEIDANGVEDKEKLKISQRLYNDVMQWEANDFGSIIRNQGYFQRGVIHDIVDDKELRWKVGIDDEHQ